MNSSATLSIDMLELCLFAVATTEVAREPCQRERVWETACRMELTIDNMVDGRPSREPQRGEVSV